MQTPRTKIVQALRLDPPQTGLRVKGWLRTLRKSKNVVFFEVNDGSCFASLQVVCAPELANFEDGASDDEITEKLRGLGYIS